MLEQFASDPEIRENRMRVFLCTLGPEWKRRCVYLSELELDLSRATILNKFNDLLKNGYIESRKYPINPRRAEYRIGRPGAEWVRDNIYLSERES